MVTLVLVAIFGVYAVRTLARGLDASANLIAWSVGVAAWGIGLANNRGLLADASTFRYRYTALGLVLLAVVPRQPVRLPIALQRSRRYAYGALLVVLILGTVRGFAVRTSLQEATRLLNAYGHLDRNAAIVASLGPSVVDDGMPMPFGLSFFSVL